MMKEGRFSRPNTCRNLIPIGGPAYASSPPSGRRLFLQTVSIVIAVYFKVFFTQVGRGKNFPVFCVFQMEHRSVNVSYPF